MPPIGRSLFPYIAVALLAAAVVWATSFSTLPPADFTFVNGTEIESVDPARVTGSPEGRIITALFEGLYRPDPKTLQPLPGVALRHDLSADKRTYTFHLRHDALWSDGTPVTAHDFAWSWQRMLHPETASQYSFLLTETVVNAGKYRRGPDVGDRVEVELADRKVPLEPHPHGTRLPGKLISITKPPVPTFGPNDSDVRKEYLREEWKLKWVYTVEINGRNRQFSKKPEPNQGEIARCEQVLMPIDEVGIKALDDWRFQVTLTSPTPYFVYLAQFYPLYPVQRACVERYGYPGWTKMDHIVTNGAYRMEYRRARDRIRLRKNPNYWDAKNVAIEVADALAVESAATGLNMYLEGQVDWSPSAPSAIIPTLQKRDDYHAQASLAIAFYRFNTTKKSKDGKPLDNVLVRRALNMAIDKEALCNNLLRAGQKPSRSFVPPGLPGYEPAQCDAYDVKKAQQLLADAGYPGGRGIGPIQILFNNSGEHGKMAEYIGDAWKSNLGLTIQFQPMEWGAYLSAVEKLSYDVARAGWTGDYPDPNTFLNLFVSDGQQNQTGWKNPRYDKLIEAAGREEDPKRRLQLFHDAEQILMEELPIVPLYSYVIVNMVKPYVRGFHDNSQDVHPLRDMSIDQAAKKKYLEGSHSK